MGDGSRQDGDGSYPEVERNDCELNGENEFARGRLFEISRCRDIDISIVFIEGNSNQPGEAEGTEEKRAYAAENEEESRPEGHLC